MVAEYYTTLSVTNHNFMKKEKKRRFYQKRGKGGKRGRVRCQARRQTTQKLVNACLTIFFSSVLPSTQKKRVSFLSSAYIHILKHRTTRMFDSVRWTGFFLSFFLLDRKYFI
jgi:hypothetical protein